MIHEMHLHAAPFLRIKSGEKRFEIRLFDEKRSKLRIGDPLLFISRENGDCIQAEIVGLYRFSTIDELPLFFSVKQSGLLPDMPMGDLAQEIKTFYSPADILKYGFLGIVFDVT